MATLFVQAPGGEQRLTVADTQTVRDALDTTALRVRAACGGNGSCGACVVQLLDGEVNPPTLAEYQKLTPGERAQGWRLSCQLRLKSDARIRVEKPARPSPWRSIPAENLCPMTPCRPALSRPIYGLAVDLGTTNIRVSLWDCKHGRRIASRCGANPQSRFGDEVLSRLAGALADPACAAQMAQLVRTAIVQALRDMLMRDVGEVKPMLAEIGRVVIVGNTAMLSLLSGNGAAALLDPGNWQQAIDYQPINLNAWSVPWRLPHAEMLLPAPIAGFVGADLKAALLATGLCTGPAGSLLLDVGTNTEIALWDGAVLHMTATPGGTAFEGAGIGYGMTAENGAICRVDHTSESFILETINGASARGFCGSGLVSALAALVAAGALKASGRFALSMGSEGYRLDPDNPRTAIAGRDVDAFQRAKAAIAAAMAELLARAGMGWNDVRRLCVCGAFGRQLPIASAQTVGLLPPLAAERIELHADAALAGCEQALLNVDGLKLLDAAATPARPLNMSCVPSYEDRFIEYLPLRPIAGS